jgi:putative transposase
MVKYLEQSYRVSERHACCVLELARATHRYDGHHEQWIELRMRIREIAQTRVRYGYRMIRVLLNREGWQVGKDLVYRLYKEEGLGLRKRPAGKRRAAGFYVQEIKVQFHIFCICIPRILERQNTGEERSLPMKRSNGSFLIRPK